MLIQRQHSRIIQNLAEVEAAIRAAWDDAGLGARAPTVVTAALDGMSMLEQVRLFHEATALVASEGGALDNFVYAPDGLAVVVLGRDPSKPFPVGCRVNATLSMDPFTHRRLFEALRAVSCPAFVHIEPGSEGAVDAALVASALVGLVADERCRLAGWVSRGGQGDVLREPERPSD